MGAGMLASPDAKRVQTICWYVRRAVACPGQRDAASITTQSMADMHCEQRPKNIDDFTVFQANTIHGKLHWKQGKSPTWNLRGRRIHRSSCRCPFASPGQPSRIHRNQRMRRPRLPPSLAGRSAGAARIPQSSSVLTRPCLRPKMSAQGSRIPCR